MSRRLTNNELPSFIKRAVAPAHSLLKLQYKKEVQDGPKNTRTHLRN